MDAKPRTRWRIALLGAGWLLMAVSPVVGVIPGPGGIFVFGGCYGIGSFCNGQLATIEPIVGPLSLGDTG